ncbi:hypothetical protein SAMN05216278_2543 [Halopelagius longus]|uniref:DUF4760 domain-containing protein n=2 Tax=Halopelagius longus TaxID=1236180 RepID=A0A1H1DS01_9EURY|nr:hypothetical protein SAMN05216278_2543 [Halopelagius longus]
MFDIQPTLMGSLLTASASLFGALVGAIVPQQIRVRNRRKNLRLALRSEINQIFLHELHVDVLAEFTEAGNLSQLLPTAVYHANAGQIGQLSSDEIEAIVTVYSKIDSITLYFERTSHEELSWEYLDKFSADFEEAHSKAIAEIDKRL